MRLLVLALVSLLLLACSTPGVTPTPDPVVTAAPPPLLVQGADGGASDDPCLDVPSGIVTRTIDADLSACSGATTATCVESALNGAIESAGLQDSCWIATLDHGVRAPAAGQTKLGLQLTRPRTGQRPTVWRARVAPTSVTVVLDDPFFVSPDCGGDAGLCFPRQIQVAETVVPVNGTKIQAISLIDRIPN